MKKRSVAERATKAGLAIVVIASSVLCGAQATGIDKANKRLDSGEFNTLARRCAPDIPLVTLRAIAHAESAFFPYALSLNYPKRTAREYGLKDGEISLQRQPHTLQEAQAWSRYLLGTGHSVSIGLFQINSEHAGELGLSPLQLFDPCTNINAGGRLLTAYYRQAASVLGEGQEALHFALSGYNSGTPVVGFRNGYVGSVVNRAPVK
jgi:type IV secretion system protein VirB1